MDGEEADELLGFLGIAQEGTPVYGLPRCRPPSNRPKTSPLAGPAVRTVPLVDSEVQFAQRPYASLTTRAIRDHDPYRARPSTRLY